LDRSADPTEHLPNSYVSRRSTEAQAFSAWTPPVGTLGVLTDEARARAATLQGRLSELRRLAERQPPPPSLKAALRRPNVSIIAEVKRASPSKGSINPGLDVRAQVLAYERGGAAAISILTEPTRFGGSNDDLVTARQAVPLPVLKKDFHVDVAQLVEAKAIGASAALLIARALAPHRLGELLTAGDDFGLELLVEVRDDRELDLALGFGATIVGVNNRNLETLEIDRETSLRLLPMIPKDVIAVAESGMKGAPDMARVALAGADAALIGSELSGSPDPESTLRALTKTQRVSGARKG
jgi:indole-3-glycerol phosphate synthase